ncbi:MAG: hypothetical protein IKY23_04160 [Lachnospiraceae bacterium]|nr:hypothetical protein [Lachnospiraceae bacterium]
MAKVMPEGNMYTREVAFCKVYSHESKEKLEKLFLANRISYFIEWQEKSLVQRLLKKESGKEKNVFIIRINEADVERARELVQGIESVKIRKQDNAKSEK